MKSYTKESLELLRSRINLLEVLSPYVQFSKSGIYYKACCPFHEEKVPSFVIQASDSHYHCFGCNAHGDAISFLMNHQKMSFIETVEFLADKFNVNLESSETKNSFSSNKKELKEIMQEAARLYHFTLLHTSFGEEALRYLYARAIDLDFIKSFQIGLSLKDPYYLKKIMKEKKLDLELLYEAGLIKNEENPRDFFTDRIMFPIRDKIGAVIGFSARKYKEETFGPKYINTPETPLFKKSKILFGLNYSRQNIAKQRKAIIVEGQVDALRLIHHGFAITVASQGTSFTQEHADELINLGINQVYLALDSDAAGREAAVKIGDFFQKSAIETYVLNFEGNMDPDSLLVEYGPKYFEKLIIESLDYLSFLVEFFSKKININSPSGKNELIQKIIERIKKWDHPLMVHESLKKLAKLTKTPESIITTNNVEPSSFYIKKEANLSFSNIDPDLVLETDFLRVLFLQGEINSKIFEISKNNLKEEHFKIKVCKSIFKKYMSLENKAKDLLSLAIDLDNAEERLFLAEMLQKKLNPEKVYDNFILIVQQILDRHWMEQREKIKLRIHNEKLTDEEIFLLAKEFDEIKNQKPQIIT